MHGHLDRLVEVLVRAAILDDDARWIAGSGTLWFIGDLVDRGPDGVGVIELVMRLEGEAAEAGGHVGCLLGNHEVMLLAAKRFQKHPQGASFGEAWLRNGGAVSDLARLTADHELWLCQLPAMAIAGDALLVHSDTTAYLRYGSTTEAVNLAMSEVLRSNDPEGWGLLFDDLAARRVFERRPKEANRFLKTFGGQVIVHGHTPICFATGAPPESVTEPLVYARGRCVNVDHGLFAGGPGFVYRLPGNRR